MIYFDFERGVVVENVYKRKYICYFWGWGLSQIWYFLLGWGEVYFVVLVEFLQEWSIYFDCI